MNNSETYFKSSSGYCHCCRDASTFQSNHAWLRDYYLCKKCGSLPRERHLQHVLDTQVEGWESKIIHESSPSNDLIGQFCGRNYSYSHLSGDDGLNHEKIRPLKENLEFLSFGDETFDLFVTKDVLEHVFNPDIAASEIMRVLKPGGAHVFTTPIHRGLAKSYPRAALVDGKIIYLKDESYHGNPVGDGRSLVTWDYGDDFENLITNWSGFATETIIPAHNNLGIDGEYLEVFVTRKLTGR